ncbi:MAG: hypothetical protein A3G49_03325 [Candidatus Sungbacteria bacterium RIFCSPLOWO2_12_FULL_41_11]|uniref:Uncharacterized protein n=1 Tax=Candidatus Sungbacteria bacterium RIFCSPLOWO2_12_FULL_41_11 TaxID=1802286 RepID=A0A1G2LT01_9BACT|nr:MAG: hypothetical protein A3D41_04180 [Candidatus Sungbacteria bacterium RIFCSPHIGHO2_02_FULL_41_12b]OHA14737.1 MAG: hypothetical protein A3G49_03325 [Candidatus Sungbacteria bacterium RIFCSPLOWO2_12_FULL_41_11]
MVLPNIKKIEDLKKIFSYKSVVYISLWAVVGLVSTGPLLDIWIFYVYGYKVVNTAVISDYTITLKRKDLTEIINMLDERKNKFDFILQFGIKDAPPMFR